MLLTLVTLDDCKFTENSGKTLRQKQGGGIYIRNSTLTLGADTHPCTITRCEAQNGGGIYIDRYAEFAMKGGVLQGNTVPTSSSGQGCAVYINTNGKFVWEGGTITGHTAGHVIKGPGTFTNNTNPPQTAN